MTVSFYKSDSYDLRLRDIPSDFWRGFPDCRNKKVFIKPNLVTPPTRWDKASTTRVEVVDLVIRYLKKNGCNDITVGDCGFKDQWLNTIQLSGYDKLVELYGIKLVGLQEGPLFHEFSLIRLNEYKSLFGAKFSNTVLECDFIVNIPKLKVHNMAIVTGAIKNCMGMMIQKGNMHPRGSCDILHKRLHDLYFLIRDRVGFCVMDGIEGSEYAEQSGIPKKVGLLISSDDMWEMDVAAAQIMGIDPYTVAYLNYILITTKRNVRIISKDIVVPFEIPLGIGK